MDISVIVPIYNVEKYLSECLNSILFQEFTGTYEIICINDGSTDNSFKILKSFEKENNKIKIINCKNNGLSAARNIGILNSVGEYLLFLDSDDYLKCKEAFEIMYLEIKKNDLDFISFNFEYDFENKSKNYIMKRNKVIKNKIMNGRKLYELEIMTKSFTPIVWNKLYKREVLMSNNLLFYEGIIHEDSEFTPKIYFLSKKVKFLDIPLIMYRQREGSITNNKNIKKINDYFIIANNLILFNQNYNSKELDHYINYIYLQVILKLRYTLNKKIYIERLRKEKVGNKLIRSSLLKYKLFGILCIITNYKILNFIKYIIIENKK